MAEQLTFYLFLSFATPSALSSPLAVTAIEAAARDSPSSLRIVLRLAFDFPFPTAFNIAPNTSDSGPVSRWDALHALLALAYNAATRVLIDRGEPLCSVEVILEGMRNVPLVVPEGAVTRRVDIPEDRRGALPAASWPDALGLGGRKGQYSVVALGGTFDHLHAGHKILLTMAAFICTKRLIVGVTREFPPRTVHPRPPGLTSHTPFRRGPPRQEEITSPSPDSRRAGERRCRLLAAHPARNPTRRCPD